MRLRAVRLTAITHAARRVAAPKVFTVKDSSGASYSVPLTVLDSAGTSYTVATTVLDSAGTSYTPA